MDGAEDLTPLQRKLRDNALDLIQRDRSQALAPVTSILDNRSAIYTYSLDPDTDEHLALVISPMRPNWGGRPLQSAVLPRDTAGIVETLMDFGKSNDEAHLWFEAYVPTRSAWVAVKHCNYGVFTARYIDLAHVVGHLKAQTSSPLEGQRLALVGTDFQWMIWIEGLDAVLCAPNSPAPY